MYARPTRLGMLHDLSLSSNAMHIDAPTSCLNSKTVSNVYLYLNTESILSGRIKYYSVSKILSFELKMKNYNRK